MPSPAAQAFAAAQRVSAPRRLPRHAPVACRCSLDAAPASSRRQAIASLAGIAASLSLAARPARAEDDDTKTLCDAACVAELASKERVTTPSGLQFQDIVVGTGPAPPVGYQVVVNYIAMTPEGRVFSNSLERGSPYDIRVGAGQVVPGLDEALSTMAVGGLRRVYIPGNLAFPKGLPSAAGRPRVPPASPVVFDVQLLYIPGLE